MALSNKEVIQFYVQNREFIATSMLSIDLFGEWVTKNLQFIGSIKNFSEGFMAKLGDNMQTYKEAVISLASGDVLPLANFLSNKENEAIIQYLREKIDMLEPVAAKWNVDTHTLEKRQAINEYLEESKALKKSKSQEAKSQEINQTQKEYQTTDTVNTEINKAESQTKATEIKATMTDDNTFELAREPLIKCSEEVKQGKQNLISIDQKIAEQEKIYNDLKGQVLQLKEVKAVFDSIFAITEEFNAFNKRGKDSKGDKEYKTPHKIEKKGNKVKYNSLKIGYQKYHESLKAIDDYYKNKLDENSINKDNGFDHHWPVKDYFNSVNQLNKSIELFNKKHRPSGLVKILNSATSFLGPLQLFGDTMELVKRNEKVKFLNKSMLNGMNDNPYYEFITKGIVDQDKAPDLYKFKQAENKLSVFKHKRNSLAGRSGNNESRKEKTEKEIKQLKKFIQQDTSELSQKVELESMATTPQLTQ